MFVLPALIGEERKFVGLLRMWLTRKDWEMMLSERSGYYLDMKGLRQGERVSRH